MTDEELNEQDDQPEPDEDVWEDEGGAPVREPRNPKNPPLEGGAEAELDRELVGSCQGV